MNLQLPVPGFFQKSSLFKRRFKLTLLALLVACFAMGMAAPAYDNCAKALNINSLKNWCSSPAQYSNNGATASGNDNPGCFPSYALENDNDVWFKFTAIATSVNISVIGAIGSNPKGTLKYPQFALYRGSCSKGLREVACISDVRGHNIAETFVNSLAVGETYYLRVDGRNNSTGTFQLCINNFSPVPSPSSDCSTAVVLCDKSSFTVPSMQNAGRNRYELPGGMCLKEESQSAWYKWTCEKPGTLTFTLKPVNPSDDLDFAVFMLPSGVGECAYKIPLRCMASGENVNEPYFAWARCTGSTGLRTSSSDIMEEQGCAEGDDNFLTALNMEAGKSYALIVNNYHNTGNGFSIEFGGTGTFAGPTAHFKVSKLKVEKGDKLKLWDSSTFSGGISKYSWNFGLDAKPQTASGPGPHYVVYSSTGKKSISLSIETGNGCQVTKIRNVTVIDPPPPPPPAPKTEPEPIVQEDAPSDDTMASTNGGPVVTTPKGDSGNDPPDEEEEETPPPPQPAKSDTVTTVVTYAVKYTATIYFKADSSTLEEKDLKTLQEIMEILQKNPNQMAIVEGHTNKIPSKEYCEKLASERADAIINWLVAHGIGQERVIRKVFGKEKLNSKDDERAMQRFNQRSEVKIVERE